MKILHTISGFSEKAGGTSTCTYDLLTGLNVLNCPTDLLTLDVKDDFDRLMGHGEEWIHALPVDEKFVPYGYSYNIRDFLKREKKYDLYHTNGMWMDCNHATAQIARTKQKPYIITPHGMLYPQALARSNWKKKIMMKLFFDKDLREATCIHATCFQEMEYYRALGYKNPVAVIPNPMPIPQMSGEKVDLSLKRIGFLGRLHPRKNVKVLLDAWALLSKQIRANAELLIMGSGESSYESFLHSEVNRLNLEHVVFSGFITGQEKIEKLSSLTALCVPSDFENFGMIVTEALIMGTPVIASKGTPWESLNIQNCGWWVNNDPKTLAETIESALTSSDEELKEMGERGKQLVLENYSLEIVAQKMKSLYEWVLGKGDKPEFVYECL